MASNPIDPPWGQKPLQNPLLRITSVDDGNRAPGFVNREVILTDGSHVDPVEDPTTISARSARSGDAIAIPYPEATWWGEPLGGKFISIVVAAATIITAANGFAITAANGNLITPA